MKKSNLMEKIEQSRKLVKSRYDLTFEEIMTLIENCRNEFDMVTMPFIYGYAQGRKAAIAEMKKTREAKAV